MFRHIRTCVPSIDAIQYTIAKLSTQPTKRKRDASTANPGAQRVGASLSVSLKNLKAPSSSISLDQPLTASIYDLKSAYATSSGADIGKIKLLHNKKPIADSKTLKDILGDAAESTKDVEFSVMVMGGVPAAASPKVEVPEPNMAAGVKQAPVVAQGGTSGAAVLEEPAFWEDLEGFLQQRLRDEGEAAELAKLFKETWQKRAGV